MSKVHDLGGSTGFGPIPHIEKDGEYAERWEYTLMALTRLGVKNRWFLTDGMRYAIERLPRDYYLNSEYYDRYVSGLTRLHIEAGLVSLDNLKEHAPVHVVFPDVSPKVPGHANSSTGKQRRFAAGDRVNVRSDLPNGHVRAPAFVHGKPGTIFRCGHAIPFPGQAGHLDGYELEYTYLVEFDRTLLWADTPDQGSVTVDLWDSYLEPAV